MPAPRDAHVPPPYGVTPVSPVITLILSRVTPTALAAICAKMASVPCPCSVTLHITVTIPVGSRRGGPPPRAGTGAGPRPQPGRGPAGDREGTPPHPPQAH